MQRWQCPINNSTHKTCVCVFLLSTKTLECKTIETRLYSTFCWVHIVQCTQRTPGTYISKRFKDTIVNLALPSLHGTVKSGSLQILVPIFSQFKLYNTALTDKLQDSTYMAWSPSSEFYVMESYLKLPYSNLKGSI